MLTKRIDAYEIILLKPRRAMAAQVKIAQLFAGLYRGSAVDPELLFSVAETVFSGMTHDDIEIKDIDDHFYGKNEDMNTLLFKAIMANYPDLVKKTMGKFDIKAVIEKVTQA